MGAIWGPTNDDVVSGPLISDAGVLCCRGLSRGYATAGPCRALRMLSKRKGKSNRGNHPSGHETQAALSLIALWSQLALWARRPELRGRLLGQVSDQRQSVVYSTSLGTREHANLCPENSKHAKLRVLAIRLLGPA